MMMPKSFINKKSFKNRLLLLFENQAARALVASKSKAKVLPVGSS
jgi:hypothetical protein